MEEKTYRTEVRDSIRDVLSGYFKISNTEVDADLVATLADVVFNSLAIEPEEEDYLRSSGTFVWMQGPPNASKNN